MLGKCHSGISGNCASAANAARRMMRGTIPALSGHTGSIHGKPSSCATGST
jgi:hypothetical protein